MTAAQPPDGRSRTITVHRAVLVALAVVPMMLSAPGQVSADSRQYLYLDPGSFLARAANLWDPTIAAGTVPHQHLGFLWPMGPWFWLVDVVGMPFWVGQRLWLAAIAAAAGLGTHRLARALGWGPTAALVAALTYQLTPYQLAFTARFSVLLLPWAALPWLVHLARRAVVEATWRAPLLFGIVAGTAGAVNASSLVLVVVAPAAVLVVGATREPARALAAGARISAATLVASAWWLGGVVVQGRYGLPVLQLTENVDTVAAASRADDVVRGLGNWIFISTDGTGTTIDQASAYADHDAVRLATLVLPALALAIAVLVRVRHRIAILATCTVAVVVAAGPTPLGDTSVYGRLWHDFTDQTSIGLALRNTPRIVPVIVLATALLLAAGIQRLPGRPRVLGAVGVVGIVVVAIAPVVGNGFLSDDFVRPEDLPTRWTEVAADLDTIALDATEPGTRVLEIPGSNFAAYTWGNTVEPVLPGLIRRPTIAREVLPAGGFGTIDLLAALDRRLLNGTFDGRSLAPLARLLGVGDIVVRGDLDTARFGLPPVGPLIDSLDTDPPPGFRVTGRYGTDAEGRPLLLRLSLLEATELLRTDASAPVLLAGDGDGIVDAATAGLLDGRRTILPAVATDPVALDDALARGGQVVVTDTNRKAAETFFYTIADDVGATETADATAPDPTGYDVRVGPYADAPTTEKTVAVQLGGHVTTSMAGGPERPEHRAVHAFDGDPTTAWRPQVAAPGQRVVARFDETVTTSQLTVLSTAEPSTVTAVRIRIGSDTTVDAVLDERSLVEPGQTIDLPVASVQELSVEILAVRAGPASAPPGIREIRVGDATVDEALRVPTELIARVGGRVEGRPLHYVFTRLRGDAADLARSPVERDVDRIFPVAVAATFEVGGIAKGDTAGACRDDLLRVDGSPVAVAVESDGRLRGCAPLGLAPGEHRLTTARATTDLAIDQVVLTTGPPVAPAALLTPRDTSLDTLDGTATVDADGPFWFTLAQSRNDGWELTVDGGRVIATSMTDGYANGWLIEPTVPGPVTLRLRWTPQRIVWAGFLITGLLVPACIVVFGLRNRSRAPTPAEWQAATYHDLPANRRAALLAAGCVPWALWWWFVSDARVAALATLALIARSMLAEFRWALAAAAPAALIAAELSDRPSLVFLALALTVTEAIVSGREVRQGSVLTWRSTLGSAGRGYQ